jgi:cytochrome b involved in lipid metabolism
MGGCFSDEPPPRHTPTHTTASYTRGYNGGMNAPEAGMARPYGYSAARVAPFSSAPQRATYDFAAPTGGSALQQPASSTRRITASELARHDRAGDAWIAVHGRVYDVSAFRHHPGGTGVLLAVAGRDGTEAFVGAHGTDSARRLQRFYVGDLG